MKKKKTLSVTITHTLLPACRWNCVYKRESILIDINELFDGGTLNAITASDDDDNTTRTEQEDNKQPDIGLEIIEIKSQVHYVPHQGRGGATTGNLFDRNMCSHIKVLKYYNLLLVCSTVIIVGRPPSPYLQNHPRIIIEQFVIICNAGCELYVHEDSGLGFNWKMFIS